MTRYDVSAWRYKYKVNVWIAGSLDGHKTYLNLLNKPGMRADFRDVIFIDKNGNLIPFYLNYYTPGVSAQFWLQVPAPNSNPIIYCYYGNGGVKSQSSFSGIGGLFKDYFESGSYETSKWDLKQYGSWGTAGIRTDYKYGNYSLGLDADIPFPLMGTSHDFAHSLLKIPLSSIPVGSRFFIIFNGLRLTASSPASFMGLGTGEDSAGGCLYSLPADSAWHVYCIKVYRSGTDSWYFYVYKDGVLDGSYEGITRSYSTYFLFGLQTYDNTHAVDDHVRIDSIISYLEASGGWISGFPAACTWGQRSFIPYKKSPYSKTFNIETSSTLSCELYEYQDTLVYDVPGLKINKPGFSFGDPEEITDESTSLSFSEPIAEITDFQGLQDFNLVSATIKKGIADNYWTFSGSFAGSLLPLPGSVIKFYATGGGSSHLAFYGKLLPPRPSFSFLGDSVTADAVDFTQNLVIQKIPWDARILKLDSTYSGWDSWINYLCDFSNNNLVAKVINRPPAGNTEISLDPKATRMEGIKKISEFTKYLFITKFINTGTQGNPVWRTGVYFLDPVDIDNANGGLDLPSPITLTAPDRSLVDAPSLEPDLENEFNTVTVYGKLSADGLFYVQTACSPRVALGLEAIREYRYEDNQITEKGTTFQKEAVRWLIYFMTRQAAVKMQLIDRFDLELYQRIRFGAGFNATLQGLTNLPAFTTCRVFDPRTPSDYQDIDISGVPRPAWLRISDMSYSCVNLKTLVSITAKVDWIHGNSDPYIKAEYLQYIGSGYFKPEISDTTSTTQGMIDNSISKQAGAQKGTVLSISGNVAQVETADGKIISAEVVSEAGIGSNVLIVPGSSGYYKK
jgi:hypothetical protein